MRCVRWIRARDSDFTVRDVFDLAVVLERNRVGVTAALPGGFDARIEALAVMPAFDHLQRSALADAPAFVEEGR
jgi:hypothetical protein